jgi:hypothetical protein
VIGFAQKANLTTPLMNTDDTDKKDQFFSKYIAHGALFDQCYQCESVVNAVFCEKQIVIGGFMNRHIYLRAYMAGVAVPTVLLLIGFSTLMIARTVYHELAPVEWLMVFPLAIVPNAFGLWNMLYVALRPRWHMPIGLHGAVLPFFIAPIGFAILSSLGYVRLTHSGIVLFETNHLSTAALCVFPFIAIAGYYLLWKYAVGFLNRVQGIE